MGKTYEDSISSTAADDQLSDDINDVFTLVQRAKKGDLSAFDSPGGTSFFRDPRCG